MVFDEMGLEHGKTLMLLPGTCCNYETNFGAVLDDLGKHYHLICVNYDGFDGSDLITCLDEDINVPHTRTHFIYANKMGKKYEKSYRKYFHDPDIHEFDMQHDQWLFGDNGWTKLVLETIYACMEMPV